MVNLLEDLEVSFVSVEPMIWDEAVDHAARLRQDGHDDWRLPTKDELVQIRDTGIVVSVERFWSGTTFGSYIWSVWFDTGDPGISMRDFQSYVVCVRSVVA